MQVFAVERGAHETSFLNCILPLFVYPVVKAAKEYDRFMAESKKDKAVKTADMDYKKKSKTEKESDP